MKKLMLGLMMAFAVTAEAEVVPLAPIGDLHYSLDTEAKTATLIGHNTFGNPPTTVDVSEVEWEEQKYTVTSVRGSAFWGCDSLTSISLPNATTIGESAFRGCGSLKEVSLPKVTTIGESAFESCGSLVSVSLPNATTIGQSAFCMCQNLKEVLLSSATTIGESAFESCGSLVSVSLPNATTIGNYVFYDCGSLTTISLPSATTIGDFAFESCGSLKEISLPKVTTIGQGAFFLCLKLEKIIVNAPMAMALKNGKSFYGIQNGCKILPEYCVVKPHPAEHSTAKVYTDGAEVTSNPIVVASNATVEVVFTVVEEGYCFEDDHSTVQTNTVTATDNPTSVDGPTVVKIPSLKEDEVGKVEWEAETTITVVSTALKSGDKILDKGEYEYACAFYGITPKTEPTAADFKTVSKDAQVVPPAPEPPEGAVTTWEALTNAIATAESGAVIAVGADITEEGGELVVPMGKAVTIKLYGKTVSCGRVTVGGALTVGDADDSVGRIVASNGAKVAKGGSVTLLGGPMRGTFTTLSPGVMLLFR